MSILKKSKTKKMESFLQKHEKELSFIAEMFLKKIKQYENNEIIG